ncbi:cupredoxin family protein [Ideonella sp. DXS29W]|uniref:Cupredoxin family protein n=1 Tax=Ideonella lacteola TaxID=2984193 RepID=A0ABU9BJT6_9BURK
MNKTLPTAAASSPASGPVRALAWALAVAAWLAPLAPAQAHGNEDHAAPRSYDPRQVDDTAFGREGDPKKVVRTIRVDMADSMRFTPAQVTIKRGQTVRFVVHNGGKVLHEMVLGTVEALKEHAELMKKFPDMEHADPNMAHVKPGATGEIVWQFTQAGRFQFACLQPGHFEAGMVGSVDVQ